jgi:DNA-binding CsgD family transcriptional regulator
METLSIDDIHKLNQGIQQLYTIHNFDTFGVDTLAIIDRLIPGDLPQFHTTNFQTHQVLTTFLPNFYGFIPKILEVTQKYFDEHPIVHQMPQTLNGVYKISDFITRQELHCLEGLYQQFLRYLDVEDQITFFIPNANPTGGDKFSGSDSTVNGFTTHRTWGKFTERDRLMLNLLRSHIFQARLNAKNYQKLAQSCSGIQNSLDLLGAIILDGEGKVESITPQAIAWLNDYFIKSTHSFQLPETLRSWMNHQVKSFTANSDLIETCLPLRIQQGERELTIRLVIEEPGVRYMLIFQEQTRSLANFVELLGLTQREVDVLLCIMQGNDNKSIASILDISISTVRKHLENIYRKLNVQSRTAAISRVLEQIGFLPSSPIG